MERQWNVNEKYETMATKKRNNNRAARELTESGGQEQRSKSGGKKDIAQKYKLLLTFQILEEKNFGFSVLISENNSPDGITMLV